MSTKKQMQETIGELQKTTDKFFNMYVCNWSKNAEALDKFKQLETDLTVALKLTWLKQQTDATTKGAVRQELNDLLSANLHNTLEVSLDLIQRAKSDLLKDVDNE